MPVKATEVRGSHSMRKACIGSTDAARRAGMAVPVPIPRANVRTAAVVKPGDLHNCLSAKRVSPNMSSSKRKLFIVRSSRKSKCLSSSRCRQQRLDLRIQILGDLQSYGVSVRGEKTRHPVIRQMNSIRTLVDENCHWRVRAGIWHMLHH